MAKNTPEGANMENAEVKAYGKPGPDMPLETAGTGQGKKKKDKKVEADYKGDEQHVELFKKINDVEVAEIEHAMADTNEPGKLAKKLDEVEEGEAKVEEAAKKKAEERVAKDGEKAPMEAAQTLEAEEEVDAAKMTEKEKVRKDVSEKMHLLSKEPKFKGPSHEKQRVAIALKTAREKAAKRKKQAMSASAELELKQEIEAFLNVEGTLAELAKEVLDVQNASNLSGVAISFAEAIKKLRKELEGSTANLNQHPITRWWVTKMESLTGPMDWNKDGDALEEMAKGEGRLAELAKEAGSDMLQNASNLSGVAQSFAKRIVELSNLVEGGNQQRDQHPITKAWVNKMVSLAGEPTSDDYKQVNEMTTTAPETEKPAEAPAPEKPGLGASLAVEAEKTPQIEILQNGKVIDTFPDAFGDDPNAVKAFFTKLYSIKEKKAGEEGEAKGEAKPEAKSDDKKSLAEQMQVLPELDEKKGKKEKKAEAEEMPMAASKVEAAWQGWRNAKGVEVCTANGGREIFPSLEEAKKKYPGLDPDKNTKDFTWAVPGDEGRMRFDDWETYRALSASKVEAAEEAVHFDGSSCPVCGTKMKITDCDEVPGEGSDFDCPKCGASICTYDKLMWKKPGQSPVSIHASKVEAKKAPNQKDLLDWVEDHVKHHGTLPGEYVEDVDGEETVWSLDEYSKFIPEAKLGELYKKVRASRVEAPVVEAAPATENFVKVEASESDELAKVQAFFENRIKMVREIVASLVEKNHVVAEQNDIDQFLLQGKDLSTSVDEALKLSADRKFRELQAQSDAELLSLKASLPNLRVRTAKVDIQASKEIEGGLDLMQLAILASVNNEGKNDAQFSIGAAFGAGLF